MKNLRAYCELSLAMSIVGSSVVVGKLITASFPIFLAGGLRFAIATLIMLPLLLFREGSLVKYITNKDYALMFLQAFCGVFLFTIFLLYGLRLTSAAEGGIITSTSPAVLGVISFLWLKEKLTFHKNIGIALTVLGILAVNVFGSSLAQERGVMPLLGNLLIFGAVVGEALFTIFRKLQSEKITPLAATTWMSLFGLLMFLPFAVYEAASFRFSAASWEDWLAILYYGIVVTVIAFMLWFQGVSKVQASTAAVFTGMMPISAIGLSYIFLGEPFSWTHVIGCGCVLLGIMFITKQPKLSNQRVKQSNLETYNHKGDSHHVYCIRTLEKHVSGSLHRYSGDGKS